MASRSLDDFVGEDEISLKDSFLNYCSSFYTRSKNKVACGLNSTTCGILRGALVVYCCGMSFIVGFPASLPFLAIGAINLYSALSRS